MSEPSISIPLALARRLSELLGERWTYDGYGDCRYCGNALGPEHRCELAQSERELDDLLSRAQPAPGAEALELLREIVEEADDFCRRNGDRPALHGWHARARALIAAHSAGKGG